jgi:hypothetical protein
MQQWPYVAAQPGGGFIVVWLDRSRDGDGFGTFGRLFDSGGSPVGDDFPVNAYTTGDQGFAVVSSLSNGDFVVVWRSPGDGDIYGVLGQRFDSVAGTIGTEFLVNSYTSGGAGQAAVAASGEGGFLVVWKNSAQDGSANGIFGQRFDSAATPIGTEFGVNSHTTGNQLQPAVASDGSGNFVVSWRSTHELSGYGVFAQLLCNDEDDDAACDRDDVCSGFDDNNDLDGDSVPDGCDFCSTLTAGQAISIKPKAILKKINTETVPGNDGLLMKGEFTLPASTDFMNLNPVVNGARLVIARSSGTVAVDVTVPGGPAWSVNGSGTKYKFVDKTKPAVNNGVVKFQIQDRSKKGPKQIKVLIKGKNGSYPLAAADEPIRATVVVGAATAGECGETAFGPSDCVFSGSGKTLKCSQ